MKKPRYSYLSYNQIAMKIDAMASSIRTESFEAIVVIVRGGAFPGTHLSIRTGLPMYFLSYERKKNPPIVKWIGEPAPQKKVLLVEDMAGAGLTLRSCRDYLIQSGYQVNTFVVFKDLKSSIKPDYHCFSSEIPGHTFLLPWEKTKINPGYETLDKSERFVDHELEFTVWNINCFVYQNELNHFEKRSITPETILEENDSILSDEPRYTDMYADWLKRHHIDKPFYSMEIAETSSSLGLAIQLGNQLMNIGCTRYVDNNVELLALLNSSFPHLEVLWWNDGNPIALTTAHTS